MGCDTRDPDMFYQPRHDPYEASTFFADGQSARPLVPGTIARPKSKLGGALYYKEAEGGFVEPSDGTGAGGVEAGGFPKEFAPPTGVQERLAWMDRGQERYNIYCSPCHGMNGQGDGMIVQRGLSRPPSFILLPQDKVENPQRYAREEFLQTAPHQHYYNVITNGYGAMYSYAARVPPEDRWKIVAYIRALQEAKPKTTTQPPSAKIGPDETRRTND